VALASGPLGIPYPVRSDLVVPTVALLPTTLMASPLFELVYGRRAAAAAAQEQAT
jgi:hypothetical protein